MPTPDGPQWSKIPREPQWTGEPDSNVHWTENWRRKLWMMKEARESHSAPITGVGRTSDSALYAWVNSSFFSPADFPTRELMRHDTHLSESNRVWDPNPNVARRQKLFKRPKGAPLSFQVNPEQEEFMHESFRGTGAPSHVTVYHHGDIPKDARYASGSVDPNWPEAVRSGWRSKDPSINRGRLHIYLVPHEDIIAEAGTEQEVFFRRGQPLNKTKRTKKKQRRAELTVEDEF